jgi:hypothetical protein
MYKMACKTAIYYVLQWTSPGPVDTKGQRIMPETKIRTNDVERT